MFNEIETKRLVGRLQILSLALLLILVYSCTKNELIYNTAIKDKFVVCDSLDLSKGKIHFSANVYNSSTRSAEVTDPIPTGRLTTIYAYTISENSFFSSSVKYISKLKGHLTPITHPMVLYYGSYALYAVSINAPNVAVPEFVDGFASDIRNGIDYLWAGVWNVDIAHSTDTVNLDFNHCYTQIQVDLVVEDTISVKSVASVMLTPPYIGGVKWDLFNSGAIGPTDSINADKNAMVNMPFKKTAFGFRSSYVMVPISVEEAVYFTCVFEIIIDDEIYNRTYSVNLPVFDNDMKAGYAYKYNLTLQRDTVLYSGVDVVDWNIIDVNGSPLIPDEVN